MKAILCASSKGGVGKSEISRLTAQQLRRDGFDVAMIDADIDSSNLSSRMGVSGRVDHDDDLIQPIEKSGIKIYSMESAFSDSSFSQSGEFMRVVIRNMINGTEWGDPDYLVVDCPPGTKDIFDELVKVLRDDLLGAVVVGQSDTVGDIGRMVKVCNHNYVPIIGMIENMSGVWADGRLINTPNSNRPVSPFGRGNIKSLADELDAKFLGHIPLCNDKNDIEEAAANTIKSISVSVRKAKQPEMPDMNEGDKGFIKNVLQALKAAIDAINSEINVSELQERFGNPHDPRTIAIELRDADSSWLMPSKIHLKIEGGLRPVRNPDTVDGGISITSQELKFALEGRRLVMDSPVALYSDEVMDTTVYGLVDAVQMGKADVWGDDVVNYLSLLDKVFTEVIDDSKIDRLAQNVD